MVAKAIYPTVAFDGSGTPVTRSGEAGVPSSALVAKRDTPATLGTPVSNNQVQVDKPSQSAQALASNLLRVKAWLAKVGEDNGTEVERVLQACLDSAEVMEFHLNQAQAENLVTVKATDERRKCIACANLEEGYCMAAHRGEVNAARIYSPMPYVLQRCQFFTPLGNS
jgi:hypothetical protein